MNKQMVLIEWIDSKGVSQSWEFLDDLKPQKPAHCISIGFLFDDQKDYKTIVQTIADEKTDPQIMARLTIPTCSIIKTKVLKVFCNE